MFVQRVAIVWAVLFMSAAWVRAETARDSFHLKQGDRVVFYGDSITEQRLYTTLAETFVLTRFPRLNVNFVHSGWSGDRVTGGSGGTIDVRLQRDVIAHRPTIVAIMLGMNDGEYRAISTTSFDKYSGGYRYIIQTLKQALPRTNITVIQPSPYDDVTRPTTFEGGYNAVLLRFGRFLQQLATEENLHFADLNTPVVSALVRARETDATLATKIIPDRIHPSAGGHLLMAAALLKSWNAPAIVTAVEIDAVGTRILHSENTQMSGLTRVGGVQSVNTLTWTQTDTALPFPMNPGDPIAALAVRSSDVIETLNQQPLRIAGLTAERYRLRIGGIDVGTFTREQLAQGINLATLRTPMLQQAAKVHELTLQHNNIYFTRWHEIQVPLQDDSFPAVQRALPPLLNALAAEEAALVAQQRAAAQPVPRRYELIAQPVPVVPTQPSPAQSRPMQKKQPRGTQRGRTSAGTSTKYSRPQSRSKATTRAR